MVCQVLEPRIIASRQFETELRVIYADTDQMGIVYHARYLEYFEVARNELLREIKLTYRSMEERGAYLPITECHLKYYKPARYDDLLTIKSHVEKEHNWRMRYRMICRVFCGESLLAEGFTIHILSDASGKPTRTQKDLIKTFDERVFGGISI